MTLLTQYHDLPHGRARQGRKAEPRRISTTASHGTAMRGFLQATITIMLGTAAFAGIIALKTAIYLPHFNY